MSALADWLSDSPAEGSHGLAAWLHWIERTTPMPTRLQSAKSVLGWLRDTGLPPELDERAGRFVKEWVESRRRRRTPPFKRGRVGITLRGSTPMAPRLDDTREL